MSRYSVDDCVPLRRKRPFNSAQGCRTSGIDRQRLTETCRCFIGSFEQEIDVGKCAMGGHAARIERNCMFQADFGALRIAACGACAPKRFVEFRGLLLIDLRRGQEMQHGVIEIAKLAQCQCILRVQFVTGGGEFQRPAVMLTKLALRHIGRHAARLLITAKLPQRICVCRVGVDARWCKLDRPAVLSNPLLCPVRRDQHIGECDTRRRQVRCDRHRGLQQRVRALMMAEAELDRAEIAQCVDVSVVEGKDMLE